MVVEEIGPSVVVMEETVEMVLGYHMKNTNYRIKDQHQPPSMFQDQNLVLH